MPHSTIGSAANHNTVDPKAGRYMRVYLSRPRRRSCNPETFSDSAAEYKLGVDTFNNRPGTTKGYLMWRKLF